MTFKFVLFHNVAFALFQFLLFVFCLPFFGHGFANLLIIICGFCGFHVAEVGGGCNSCVGVLEVGGGG